MNNPVAKNAGSFNKSAVMRDRKKDDKRGYTKHKFNPDEVYKNTVSGKLHEG